MNFLCLIFAVLCLIQLNDARSFLASYENQKEAFTESKSTQYLKDKRLDKSTNVKNINNESLEIDLQNESMIKPNFFEGDIVLTDEQWALIRQEIRKQSSSLGNESFSTLPEERTLISNLAQRWTLPIRFFINSDVNATAVLAGIAKWEKETCIPCSSYVGKVGTSFQEISIVNQYYCLALGGVCHEIGHALGFFHEHNRYDRDEYIRLQTQNIKPSSESQFKKEPASLMNDYGLGYDYGSIMHYSADQGSANNKPTLITRDPNYQTTVGQRVDLSFADVKKVNLAYCNSKCSNTLACRNGGYVDPNNCQQCKCPLGLGGSFCETVALSSSGCGKGDLTATNSVQSISATGPKTCNYLITAPPGRRVFFRLTEAREFEVLPNSCPYAFVSVNYSKAFTKNGIHACRTTDFRISTSEHEQIIVIYHGFDNSSRFTMNYRIA
ncbi:hypothetical protein CAEBREN_07523 [Caenorhabditis brenneri]|uniref:Zinc metalloproteinase n=1 Tax=Caenorhabditis brenneri TaxID=135651 RepID=G0MB80_CAEBE|nr:hypothetical protein CAEBREN_07523 [Caenorhabditis brenneri]